VEQAGFEPAYPILINITDIQPFVCLSRLSGRPETGSNPPDFILFSQLSIKESKILLHLGKKAVAAASPRRTYKGQAETSSAASTFTPQTSGNSEAKSTSATLEFAFIF